MREPLAGARAVRGKAMVWKWTVRRSYCTRSTSNPDSDLPVPIPYRATTHNYRFVTSARVCASGSVQAASGGKAFA
jgi:hypothetical protein